MTVDDMRELVDQCQWRRWRREDGTRYNFKIHDCEDRSCKFSYTYNPERQYEPENSGGGDPSTPEKEEKQLVDMKDVLTDKQPERVQMAHAQDPVKTENVDKKEIKEEKKAVRFA